MQEFNKGVYDYIIATDEGGGEGKEEENEGEDEEGNVQEEQCKSAFTLRVVPN